MMTFSDAHNDKMKELKSINSTLNYIKGLFGYSFDKFKYNIEKYIEVIFNFNHQKFEYFVPIESEIFC